MQLAQILYIDANNAKNWQFLTKNRDKMSNFGTKIKILASDFILPESNLPYRGCKGGINILPDSITYYKGGVRVV